MLKHMGKFLGQMIPPIMATIIGAYLVQQIFPGKNAAETKSPAPTAAVMSPTPMAPASKLAKSLSGPPAEPTEITGPNKTVKEPAKQAPIKEASAPAAAPVAPAPATTGTVMPRRVGPPGPVPLVARERGVEPPPAQPTRVEASPAPPPAREEAAVPPLELAAKVIAALPPSKPASPRDLPETRDGAYTQPNAGSGVSVAPLPPPSIAPTLSPPPPGVASLPPPPMSSAPMPITPPGIAAAPLPPPPMQGEVPRAPVTRDPVQLSDADREHLARIPLPLPDGVEPHPRRPSLFERGGALVKGVVSSVKSVLPGQQRSESD
jgi:hypothetical protein